ncbi:MAG: hypothetical protein ABL889_04310 [Terricaulis sp.]
MIARLSDSSTHVAQGPPNPAAPAADAILTTFETTLQAAERNASLKQTAIAFDRTSIFGAAPATSPLGSEKTPTVSAPPVMVSPNHIAASGPSDTSVGAALGDGMSYASLAQHDRPTAEHLTLRAHRPLIRTCEVSLPASDVSFIDAPRASTTHRALRSSNDVRLRAAAFSMPKATQQAMVVVQETEHGLRILARARGLNAKDLPELRSEAEALLARHGYSVFDLDINTGKKE